MANKVQVQEEPERQWVTPRTLHAGQTGILRKDSVNDDQFLGTPVMRLANDMIASLVDGSVWHLSNCDQALRVEPLHGKQIIITVE